MKPSLLPALAIIGLRFAQHVFPGSIPAMVLGAAAGAILGISVEILLARG